MTPLGVQWRKPIGQLLHKDLTNRELEVLLYISIGLSNPEIATVLCLGKETIKSHVRHLLQKMDGRNRADLVTIGFEKGLLTIPSVKYTRRHFQRWKDQYEKKQLARRGIQSSNPMRTFFIR